MMMRPQRRRDNRPGTKPRQRTTRPVADDTRPLFHELMKTRWQYEAVRSSDGSLLERAVMLDRLQELRADLARARRGDM